MSSHQSCYLKSQYSKGAYKQRRAPACLHQEEMPPFPLALGFNAAIPPRSRVAKSPAQFTVC